MACGVMFLNPATVRNSSSNNYHQRKCRTDTHANTYDTSLFILTRAHPSWTSPTDLHVDVRNAPGSKIERSMNCSPVRVGSAGDPKGFKVTHTFRYISLSLSLSLCDGVLSLSRVSKNELIRAKLLVSKRQFPTRWLTLATSGFLTFSLFCC